ncbi:MAG: glycosyltransferase family 2 protein [Calditrichia bacterium]
MTNRLLTCGNHKIGIIIPAFNPMLPALRELIERIKRSCCPFNYRILLVDDGSHPPLKKEDFPERELDIIRHRRNQGKGSALKSGFTYFLKRQPADLLIMLDADLQHPPEKIPSLLRAYEKWRSPIITGARRRDPRVMPLHRILSNTLTSLIISLLVGQLVRDSQCGFRLIETRILSSLPLKENGFHLEGELLLKAGWRKLKISSVPIPTIYNKEKSSIKNFSDTLNFVFMVVKALKEKVRL